MSYLTATTQVSTVLGKTIANAANQVTNNNGLHQDNPNLGTFPNFGLYGPIDLIGLDPNNSSLISLEAEFEARERRLRDEAVGSGTIAPVTAQNTTLAPIVKTTTTTTTPSNNAPSTTTTTTTTGGFYSPTPTSQPTLTSFNTTLSPTPKPGQNITPSPSVSPPPNIWVNETTTKQPATPSPTGNGTVVESTTSTTTIAGTIQPGTTVGVTFTPTQSPSKTPTASPTIYTDNTTATPTGAPTLVAGKNSSSTTTTTTPGSTTTYETTSTTLLLNTTNNTANATVGTNGSTTLMATPMPTPRPSDKPSTTTTTTYAVNTTSTSATTTSSTKQSTTTTTTSLLYAKNETGSTTLAVGTTPTTTDIPTSTWIANTSTPNPPNSGVPTPGPTTFAMGSVLNNTTTALPAVPGNTPAPTTSIDVSTTPLGLTTSTTTTLPSLSPAQSPTTVNATFGPGSGSNLTFLANTSYVPNNNTSFLAPTGGDKGAGGSKSGGLSMSEALKVVGILAPFGTALLGASIFATLQLINWGSRLRGDILVYRERAARGDISPISDNEAAMLQRASSKINRLSYWMVNGKWCSPINDRDPGSLRQVMNEILQTNRDAQIRLRELADDAIASRLPTPIQVPANDFVADERQGFFPRPTTFGSNAYPFNSLMPNPVAGPPYVRPTINLLSTGAGTEIPSDGRKLGIDPPSVISQEIPLILTKDIRIFELWCLITKAQQLPYSDQSRADFLVQALVKYQQILFEGHISLYDLDTLQNNLALSLQKEFTDLALSAATANPSVLLAGTQSLNVSHLDNDYQFIWNVNFTAGLVCKKSGWESQANAQLMDLKKPVFFDGSSQSLQAKSVSLDAQHSQYVASNCNQFITIGGDVFENVPTKFNVVGGDGNDIFSIAADTLGNNSSVNLFGGRGKNTYIIYGKGSWSKLASTIHIFDFDPSKDTILLATSDGAINLTETQRTLFDSTFKASTLYPDGRVTVEKKSQYDSSFSWMPISKSAFKAAEHVFEGDGMPTIVIDETNYKFNNLNSIFSAIKYQPTSRPDQLSIGTITNTQFGQLSTNGEHQLYKVHLNAGQSYVFTLNCDPHIVVGGDLHFNQTLALKDSQKNNVLDPNLVSSKDINGNTRIDYFALVDHDYLLDVGGSFASASGQVCPANSNVSVDEGKYAIGAVEIPHKEYNIGTTVSDKFDGTTNHVGYKMSLNAGNYLELNFNSGGGHTNVTLTDPNGRKVVSYQEINQDQNKQTFMAQKTGDYYMDATVDSFYVNKETPFQLTSAVKDIEGSASTKANLSINSVINGFLANKSDHDWFRVTLEGNKRYEFDIASKRSLLQTHSDLIDQYGFKYQQSVDKQGSDGYFHSKFICDVTGKGTTNFYLDVSSKTNNPFGFVPGCTYTATYHVI